MTPRPYKSRDRQKAVDAGRERIIAAARELLQSEGEATFSVDAVARRAGTARMTVYNQFVSKAGLLEALFDNLAQHGELVRLPDVFAERDPWRALDRMVAVFGRFWTIYRRVHRSLRLAADQDPELAAAMAQRNERRRRGLTELIGRIPGRHVMPLGRDDAIQLLFMLLSFETFDALAGDERTPEDVVPLVQQVMRLATGAPQA